MRLYLLGPPRVELDGEPIALKRRKALALLSYLALSQRRQPRDSLAALLWPENSQGSARKALRRDLSELNRALQGDWLDADRESVGLRSGYWLDVTHFQQQTAAAQDDPTALAAAIELFRDDFLAGFSLADAPDFDDWQRFQSESLRQILTSALERMTELLNQQRELEPAISYARRWVALDPLHEPAQRQLMGLYAQAGQVAAALRQYQACVATLATELGVPPADETTALYEQIRAGKLADIAPGIVQQSSVQTRYRLPTQTTSFVGRAEEVAEIQRLLLADANCRLLNLVGPGGVGKTRLALAAASQVYDAFSHGACFVSLATVDTEAYVVPTIADALGLTLDDQSSSQAQVLDYLHQKQLLLIVDNLEHLVDGSVFFSELLHHCPDLVLLATSRERLHLQEEWVFEVKGLSFPSAGENESAGFAGDPIENYGAPQLFIQRARQVRPNFALSTTDLGDLLRICQLVEGLPLGLELAAAWVRVLSCREIAEEIEKGIAFLSTTQRNLPVRHRSLEVVFEHSWQLLSATEQAVFARCALFQGGFTRTAAFQVAGATLPILAALIDKSLLRREATDRYVLHELARQCARQKLRTFTEAAQQATAEAHASHFLQLIRTQAAALDGSESRQAIDVLQADAENIQLAWNWACAQHKIDLLANALEPLARFYKMASLVRTGEQLFAAPAAMQTSPQAAAERRLFAGQIPYYRAEMLYLLARYDEANVIAGDVYTLALATDDVALQAQARILMGQIAFKQGRHATAHHYCEQGYKHSLQLNNDRLLAWALDNLGNAMHVCKVQDYGLRHHEQACQLARQQGDLWALATYLNNLGWMYYDKWEFETALTYFQQALTIQRQLNVRNDMIETHLRVGQTYHHLHKDELALPHYQQAVRLTTELGLRDNSQAWLGIGNVYRRSGEWDHALWWLERARRLLADLGKLAMLAECTADIAGIFSSRGEYSLALARRQEALDIYLRLKSQPAAAHQYCHLGIIYHRMGNHESAQQALGQALTMARALGDRSYLPQILQELGEVAFSMKAFEASKAYCEECLQLLRGYGAQQHFFRQRDVQLSAEILLVKLAFLHGDKEQARQQLETMLAAAATPAEQAEVYFTRWQLDRDPHSRDQALARYRQLYARAPYYRYRQRLQELTTGDHSSASFTNGARMSRSSSAG